MTLYVTRAGQVLKHVWLNLEGSHIVEQTESDLVKSHVSLSLFNIHLLIVQLLQARPTSTPLNLCGRFSSKVPDLRPHPIFLSGLFPGPTT